MQTQRENEGRGVSFSEIWFICSDTSRHGLSIFSKYVSDYVSQEVDNIDQDLVQKIKKEKNEDKKKKLQQLAQKLENFIQANSALLHKIDHPMPIVYTALKGGSEILDKLRKALKNNKQKEMTEKKATP